MYLLGVICMQQLAALITLTLISQLKIKSFEILNKCFKDPNVCNTRDRLIQKDRACP